MNTEMQIIREVNIQAENFYNEAVQLGDHASFALGRSRRSQMTGLENVADNALKASDIFDYIKRQTARSDPFSDWRRNFSEDKYQTQKDGVPATMGLGERLISYLEQELNKKCEAIYDKYFKKNEQTSDHQHLRRRIYLLLIRQFVHQMVAEYEFRVNIGNNKTNNNKKGAR